MPVYPQRLRLLRRLHLPRCKINGGRISIRPQSANDSNSLVRQEALVPELLAAVDVANVHLDKRDCYAGQGVADGDTRVREPARVDDDEVTFPSCLVNAIDDEAFVVGLERRRRKPEFL